MNNNNTSGSKILTGGNVPPNGETVYDDGMIFNRENIEKYINDNHNYGFIVIVDSKIVGLAYCYDLTRLDGKSMLYMHSVGILPEYQNMGLGSKLIEYVTNYGRENGFSELFVITDKGNKRACRVYEKAGLKNDYEDEIVYVIDYIKER